MGIVYLAWDLLLRQTFAIKVLRPDVAKAEVASLRREAAIAIGLNHESIARLHHFEPRDDALGPFLVMEYVPWDSGDRLIADAGKPGLPAASVLSVGATLCDALAHAHDRGVLHGDIKPSNVFVDPSGTRAKLGDFGLARVVGGPKASALLVRLAGTPAYMAPEQKQVGASVTPATDVYLLATTLWTCLQGHPPSQPVVMPKEREPARRAALKLLRSALGQNPEGRPRDAREFAAILGRSLAAR
jgi:serine/threonine protein kinase